MKWNLRMVAAQRGIWRASELRRTLADAGLVFSAGKMSNLWSGNPISIRLEDLNVICSVLECEPNDLFFAKFSAAGEANGRDGRNDAHSPALTTAPRPFDASGVNTDVAGVHALSRKQIVSLRVDQFNLKNDRFSVKGRPRPLDTLTRQHLFEWLDLRQSRWPRTSNPHLLVTASSANRLVPVGLGRITQAFVDLKVTASELRVDRLVSEAMEGGGDALRIALLFEMSHEAIKGYASSFGPFDDERTASELNQLRPRG